MDIYRSPQGRRRIHEFVEQAIVQWGVPHERRYVPTSAGPVHVLTAGTGEPVVLLPGTNFSSCNWLELVGRLAQSHRVHAIDLPGQPGLSSGERPRTRVDHGRWLAELLPVIASPEPLVLGHSLGAAVALAGASSGARYAKLVLVDPAGVMRLSVTPQIMRPTIPWLLQPTVGTSRPLLSMMMSPGTHPTSELARWMSLVGRHVKTSLAPRPHPAASLRVLDATPTTVVSGQHDVFLPPRRLSRAVAAKLPGARLRIVEEAGHLLPQERPEELEEAVS